LFSLLLALVGIPFIRFNYYEAPAVRNPVLAQIEDYLPQMKEDKGPSDT
jgi:hypothetical protein